MCLQHLNLQLDWWVLLAYSGVSSNPMPSLHVPCDKSMMIQIYRPVLPYVVAGPRLLLPSHAHTVKERTISLQGQALITVPSSCCSQQQSMRLPNWTCHCLLSARLHTWPMKKRQLSASQCDNITMVSDKQNRA